MKRTSVKLVSIALLLISGCLEPYAPPELNKTVNFLVVDGFLNSTEGTVLVRLTRANALSETSEFMAEQNAQVVLKSETGAEFPLSGDGVGNYSRTGLTINTAMKYKLEIRTTDAKVYESDLVAVIETPPIDSVTWRAGENGIDILVNTHDDTNNTRYYLWKYTETWQYNAPQQSSYKFENGTATFRTNEEQIFTCYRSQPSTRIRVHSSNRLGADVIRDFSVNFLPARSRKLSNRYSILVQQTGISREAYEFWSLLEQTTENIGGLFDPQPGKVIGNLSCRTEPTEPVLGIFQAGVVREERIYINFLEIPAELRYLPPPFVCQPDSVLYNQFGELPNLSSTTHLIVNAIYSGLTVIGFTYTTHPCADCRLEGGTLTKPDFWE